ncbi:sterile alpha motif domain-containing protein 11 isoform X7 [Zalophus californianus]|uniref:Sterile alpha motif domain-containing protein 11 isoform X7 n=1 Tax=Zalophus californianus TaxID=9704 RepID=A0A6J2FCN5_ZALCA|nr:sterile alpha motif domain-containing protein 11 isoform X7 [Zalophus californianus]
MPAVKKELPGREDLALALATFHPTLAALPLPPLPGYLTPLPAAAALPPAASLPAATAGYEALLAPPLGSPRAYLSLHEAAPHLHLPRDPLALERFSATAAAAPDFQPLLDNGEPCIEVECGANRALLYVRKLCQGSKGPSIRHRGEWLTPNEFQFVSGRETAKDWKRSIRHKGKSLKTLMSKGILQVHPPICDCPGCRISSPVNRGRLADKRTVALPTARVLKKELTPSFSPSDGDSDGSGPACGRRPGLKQEDTPHVRIMKRRVHTHWDVNISFRETSCSQDSDLPTLISSVHRSRHLVMPEHQSRCEFQRGGVEIGLGASGATGQSYSHRNGSWTGRAMEDCEGPNLGPCRCLRAVCDLLGKRLGRSPHISSDCPLEKKARSKSPQETLLLPELGPSMAPEDHYRRLVSALSEASTFEDPQRLYHLGLPSHDLLRVRQEVAAAAVRSPSGLEVHLPSSTAGQRRKQGLAQHREGTMPAGTPSFSERELSQPPPLLSPQNAPHIALGPHLRPPFLGVPSALCQTPGGDAGQAAGAPAEAEPGPAGDVCRAAASEGAGERAPASAAGARSRPAPVGGRRRVAAARGHAGAETQLRAAAGPAPPGTPRPRPRPPHPSPGACPPSPSEGGPQPCLSPLQHHGGALHGWGGGHSPRGPQQVDSGRCLQLCGGPVRLRRICTGIQRTGDRWGDLAPADRGAPPDHHGAEARACSQDPGPGGQAPRPSLLHGQLPCGSAAAATNAAGPRAGAHLWGAAPVPNHGPLPLWGGAPPCWPSLAQAREWNCGSAPRPCRTPPASVLNWWVRHPDPYVLQCQQLTVLTHPTAYLRFGFGCKNAKNF